MHDIKAIRDDSRAFVKGLMRRGMADAQAIADSLLEKDKALRAIDARHLFQSNKIFIGIQKHTYVRGVALEFIKLFAPAITAEQVAQAVAA